MADKYQISNAIAEAAVAIILYPWMYKKLRKGEWVTGSLDGQKMYAILHLISRRAYDVRGPVAPNQSKFPGIDRTTLRLYLQSACESGLIARLDPKSPSYPNGERYAAVAKYGLPVYDMSLERINYFVTVKAVYADAPTFDKEYGLVMGGSPKETFKVEDDLPEEFEQGFDRPAPEDSFKKIDTNNLPPIPAPKPVVVEPVVIECRRCHRSPEVDKTNHWCQECSDMKREELKSERRHAEWRAKRKDPANFKRASWDDRDYSDLRCEHEKLGRHCRECSLDFVPEAIQKTIQDAMREQRESVMATIGAR